MPLWLDQGCGQGGATDSRRHGDPNVLALAIDASAKVRPSRYQCHDDDPRVALRMPQCVRPRDSLGGRARGVTRRPAAPVACRTARSRPTDQSAGHPIRFGAARPTSDAIQRGGHAPIRADKVAAGRWADSRPGIDSGPCGANLDVTVRVSLGQAPGLGCAGVATALASSSADHPCAGGRPGRRGVGRGRADCRLGGCAFERLSDRGERLDGRLLAFG